MRAKKWGEKSRNEGGGEGNEGKHPVNTPIQQLQYMLALFIRTPCVCVCVCVCV